MLNFRPTFAALPTLALFVWAGAALIPGCVTTQDPNAPPPLSPEATQAGIWADSDPAPVGQLPGDVTPTAYLLDLTLDPSQPTFGGEVHIEVVTNEWRKHMWLHGANLQVTSVVATGVNTLTSGAFTQVNEEGLARIDFDTALAPGKYVVELSYRAPWDENLKGLYRVQQGDDWYAFTQFEATSARFAFPCFDEPRFKTPFSLTVTAREGDAVVTTTRERAAAPVDKQGAVRHTFGKTRPLPTYLIAFAVGPMDAVDIGRLPPTATRPWSLPVTGYAVKGKGMEMAFAMKQVQPILEALESYFGREYPFEKLDLIAVPDFASGAMENVGAVTFREVLLLVDENKASAWQRRAMVSVMAHEFAHMWFGNLVTMPWWDDIWLNEAFATWMAYRIVSDLYPDLGLHTALTERVHGAMGQDALVSARQIRQDIKSDHDIRNAFDSITYSKGGGMLAMFEQYMGRDTFRDAIRRYMKTHSYGSATYEDLLFSMDEFQRELGKPEISTAFKSFLFQPGVPFLNTQLDCTTAPKVTVSQSRFFPIGSTGDAAKSWSVPVCVAAFTADGARTKHCAIVDAQHNEVALGDTCPASVFVNADAAGYYRFQHNGAQPLLAQLNEKEKLAAADALNASFSAGTAKLDAYLDGAAALAVDPAYGVALAPVDMLHHIRADIATDAQRAAFDARVRSFYAPQLARLGTAAKPADTTDDKRLRPEVIGVLLHHGEVGPLLAEMSALGARFVRPMSDGEVAPDADLRRVALTAYVQHDGAAALEALLARLAVEQDAAARMDLIVAAASARGENAAQGRALMVSDTLRKNEVRFAAFAAFSHPEIRDEAWTYFTTNYDAINARIPTTRQGAMPWLGAVFCSEEKQQSLEAFFAPKVKDLPGGPRNLLGASEAVTLCAARAAHYRPSADVLAAPVAKPVAATDAAEPAKSDAASSRKRGTSVKRRR